LKKTEMPMCTIRERAWSPYVTGILIGLLLIPAMLFADALSQSVTTLATVTGSPFTAAGPATGYGWPVALLVGIGLGASLSATAAGSRHSAPSPIWTRVLGAPSPKRRAVAGFAGGFLMVPGALLAGGDLTDHGLSGVVQQSAGSFLALAAIMAGGLVTGRLLHRL
jgi:hypothetical protein